MGGNTWSVKSISLPNPLLPLSLGADEPFLLKFESNYPDGWATWIQKAAGEGRMMAKLFEAIFGCRHSNYSFPITVRAGSRRDAATLLTGTYVSVWTAAELPYDWQDMKVITSKPSESHSVGALAHKSAA